ncbi:hypothetical protein ASPZODRAFT_13765 [Penicilliopsis zonata CBS 506.65]|uniref:Glycosyltransferase 2-like domain-containing protein n=1 Tax=Penicilliopsis zonata CBS 506.65 TaxID=1073090 RepID=A0A1L9SPA4_9EURO|nr:hypothetical protein ASPZODRAFT_13765 [Penicilliopsis zonata CBS 506.65]OJJ49028.1 hypothetical protein ASPZODRAFT_13765 [Penicilliopsis zonata CBS 506.65]
MLRWFSRCLPGFSILALLLLMLVAFSDSFTLLPWPGVLPYPVVGGRVQSIAREIFVVYALLVHLNMFAFTLRLSWSLFRVTEETRKALQRRSWHAPGSSSSLPLPLPPYSAEQEVQLDRTRRVDEADELEVVHAIILPNYCEDHHTLRTTLNVLASHPRASTQYEIYLAMEQKEQGAAEKAAMLVSAFEKAFHRIYTTFHPANLQGEIAGKSSNVSFAASRVVEVHRMELNTNTCDVIITVMDSDTHLSQDYFTEIRRLHFEHLAEADRSFYSCPIIFDRNSHETPILVRCADLLWGFAGLSTMYPGAPISIPTSVYSLPLTLAEKVGGWDSDPTAIGEDMHMLLKCYFGTMGNIISRTVFIPASQCNISSDRARGWRRTLDTCNARYKQALRHMWGALDTGFAIRNSATPPLGPKTSRRTACLFAFRPRHLALLSLLFEAHFLPCHGVIIMLFSVLYTLYHPTSQLSPLLARTFRVTDLLRTACFLWMNVCLALYERWHALCLSARMKDMMLANLNDTGFSRRTWWHTKYLCERVCFPVAGTLYGAIPTLQAVFSHFWTDRLVYRVSKKPTFEAV